MSDKLSAATALVDAPRSHAGSVEQIGCFEFRYRSDLADRADAVFDRGACMPWVDSAWAAMLLRCGIVPDASRAIVAHAVRDFLAQQPEGYCNFAGLERWVSEHCGVEHGGSLTIGRTVPPLMQMARVRHHLLGCICICHEVIDALIELASAHVETVMPGYTHIRHAQPTTFGHYLLSVVDPLQRIMREVEHGYQLMSLNEIGCGALAGTSLPIDRDLVGRYLGLTGLIENANDAVCYTDGYVTLVAALANLNAVASRFSFDLNVWSSEEYGFCDVPWERVTRDEQGRLRREAHTHSHFMPNKTNNCPHLERSRVGAAEVLGALTEVCAMGMRSPHADMHEMLHMADGTVRAIRSTSTYFAPYVAVLPQITVFPERMHAAVAGGWSAATELGNRLVREHGLDYRSAHELLNVFIQGCKQRGVGPEAARGEDLDRTASELLGRTLDMGTGALRAALDPDCFVAATGSRGGVAPQECRRMLADRRAAQRAAWQRHAERIATLESARATLDRDLQAMAGGAAPAG